MSWVHQRSIAAVLGCLLIGTLAYAAGLRARPAPATQESPSTATEALFDWLQLTPQQRSELVGHDPRFADDLKSLRDALEARRAEFAAALDDPNSADRVIRSRLEAAIAGSGELQRRIADFLLSARQHLTAEQQRRLFELCAEEVRRGGGRQQGGGAGRGRGYGGPPWQDQAGPQSGPRGRGWGRGGNSEGTGRGGP